MIEDAQDSSGSSSAQDGGGGGPPLSLGTETYLELQRRARNILADASPTRSIQPTMLVHDAWNRLSGKEREEWSSRSHFLAAAARTMRHVLVDHVRVRDAEKRGGGRRVLTVISEILGRAPREFDLVELHDLLGQLQSRDPRAAEVVELKFFGGLTTEEIAQHLGVSKGTVEGDWRHARAWLLYELSRSGSDPGA